MPRAYSLDLRERLPQANDAGLSSVEIERTTGVSRRSLSRWRQKLKLTDDLTPGRPTGRPRKVTLDHDRQLETQVTEHPDWTLAQHAEAFAQTTGIAISPATISRRFAQSGISLKKRP